MPALAELLGDPMGCAVTLSRDLLGASAKFRAFVIAHEPLHLQVPNHGRLFRSLMRSFVPDCEGLAAGRVSRSFGFQTRSTGEPDARSR